MGCWLLLLASFFAALFVAWPYTHLLAVRPLLSAELLLQSRVLSLGHRRRAALFFFFFQAEDGIRDADVTGVQTCALPISVSILRSPDRQCSLAARVWDFLRREAQRGRQGYIVYPVIEESKQELKAALVEIGRASCRERG